MSSRHLCREGTEHGWECFAVGGMATFPTDKELGARGEGIDSENAGRAVRFEEASGE